MKSMHYCLISLVAMLSFSTVASANEMYGTMMVVKGDVKVTSAKTSQTNPVKVGSKVYSGDTIISGADSRAKVVMSDKNVINISPESKITIAKYENNAKDNSRNVELKVDYGKVRASVEQKYDGEKNKFNIRTPTAVAGVRGTDFLTGFNPSTRRTQITTFSGVVAVGQPGTNGQISNPVYVRPGQSTNVENGKPPEPPKPMPKEELQNMQKETSADTASNKKDDGGKKPEGDVKKDGEAKKEEAKKEDSKPQDKQAESKPADGDKKAEGGDKKPADSKSADNSAPADKKAADGKQTAKTDSPNSRAPASDAGPNASGPTSGGDAPKSGKAGPMPPPSMPSMTTDLVKPTDLPTNPTNIPTFSGPPPMAPPNFSPAPPAVNQQPTTNPLIEGPRINPTTKVNITIQ